MNFPHKFSDLSLQFLDCVKFLQFQYGLVLDLSDPLTGYGQTAADLDHHPRSSSSKAA